MTTLIKELGVKLCKMSESNGRVTYYMYVTREDYAGEKTIMNSDYACQFSASTDLRQVYYDAMNACKVFGMNVDQVSMFDRNEDEQKLIDDVFKMFGRSSEESI